MDSDSAAKKAKHTSDNKPNDAEGFCLTGLFNEIPGQNVLIPSHDCDPGHDMILAMAKLKCS